MITINQINDKEVRSLYEEVYNNLNKRYRKNLDEWCIKQISSILHRVLDKTFSDKPFLDIMLLSFNEIKELSEDTNFIKLNYMFSIVSNKRIKKKKVKSIKNYLIDNVYKSISSKRRKILSITNLSVCPYCNRNFMNSSQNNNTCELDHFFHKSKFPILAASFYNLIPSCPSCNRNKSTNDFLLSPYNNEISTDNRITFSWRPKNGDFLYNHDSIEIISNTHDKYKNDFSKLDLNGLYQIHSDLILDMLIKKIFIPDTYLNEISKMIPLSSDDINKLYTGVYNTEKDYYKRPLSKLISDIYKELNNLER